MCETGTASSMWPMRSRRTRAKVTSTPQRSQITPLCLIRLYFPQEHSQSRVGPMMRSQRSAHFFGLKVRYFIVYESRTSPYLGDRLVSLQATPCVTGAEAPALC